MEAEARVAVLETKVQQHSESLGDVWETVNEVRKVLADLRVNVALIVGGFGVLQTIITGCIVHYATR